MGLSLAIRRRDVVALLFAAALTRVLQATLLPRAAADDAAPRGVASGIDARSSAQSDDEDSSPGLDNEQWLVRRRARRVSQLPPAPIPPHVDATTFNPIDAFIAARWSDAPSGPQPQLCDEATFLRRVYLDLVGVIPSWKEANRFLAGRDSREHREKLVDALLARDRQYAVHWTPF